MLSSIALLDIAMHCIALLVQAFIASRLDYCNVLYYGIYDELIRRLQSVQNAAARLVRALGDQITSRLCFASYTGFRCGSASCSRSRRSSTSRCAVTLRATSSTTVSWSLMYAPENCVLLTLERSLSTGPAAVLVTGRSLLLRLEYGTVCRLT